MFMGRFFHFHKNVSFFNFLFTSLLLLQPHSLVALKHIRQSFPDFSPLFTATATRQIQIKRVEMCFFNYHNFSAVLTMFRFLVLFNCCKSAKILVSTRELSIRNICCCFSWVKANFMSGLLAQISLQIFVLLRDCCVFFFLHPRQLIVIVIIMKCSAQFALSRNIQKHRTWRKNNIFILSCLMVRTAGIFRTEFT